MIRKMSFTAAVLMFIRGACCIHVLFVTAMVAGTILKIHSETYICVPSV